MGEEDTDQIIDIITGLLITFSSSVWILVVLGDFLGAPYGWFSPWTYTIQPFAAAVILALFSIVRRYRQRDVLAVPEIVFIVVILLSPLAYYLIIFPLSFLIIPGIAILLRAAGIIEAVKKL